MTKRELVYSAIAHKATAAGPQAINLTGEGYKAKAGCVNGIESVKKNAPDAPVEEV